MTQRHTCINVWCRICASVQETQFLYRSGLAALSRVRCYLIGSLGVVLLINPERPESRRLWSVIGEVTVWGQPATAVKRRGRLIKYLKSITSKWDVTPNFTPSAPPPKNKTWLVACSKVEFIFFSFMLLSSASCSPWRAKLSSFYDPSCTSVVIKLPLRFIAGINTLLCIFLIKIFSVSWL